MSNAGGCPTWRSCITTADHAVLVAPILPAADGNGLAMRAGLLLEALARRYRVHVAVVPLAMPAPLSDPPPLLARAAESWNVLALEDFDEARRWPTQLLSTAEGRRRAADVYPLPVICRRVAGREIEALRGAISAARGVVVMRSYLAPSLDFLLDDPARPPIVLDVDELDSRLAAALGDADAAAGYARLEAHYLPRFDHLLAASAPEAGAVRATVATDAVTVVPNAVPRPPTRAATGARDVDLLFVGNLSYAPNVTAAGWLCRRVLPLLPETHAAIVGSRPVEEVRALGELPGVRVAADVPELESWYARSRIAVAPLFAGGGTRTKILEAMSHGLPVVATPAGAAGLSIGEAHGMLVADTPDRFAAACRGLLGDPGAAARIGAAGRSNAPDRDAVIEMLAARLAAVFG